MWSSSLGKGKYTSTIELSDRYKYKFDYTVNITYFVLLSLFSDFEFFSLILSWFECQSAFFRHLPTVNYHGSIVLSSTFTIVHHHIWLEHHHTHTLFVGNFFKSILVTMVNKCHKQLPQGSSILEGDSQVFDSVRTLLQSSVW